MLIEFSVTNWRSIKSKQTISFVKRIGTELEQSNSILIDGFKDRLLKSCVFFGPNASGKSNLLKALEVVKKIVLKSAIQQHGVSIPVVSFKLNSISINEPSEFELIFIQNSVRYQYGFSADSKMVFEEWLYAFPKNKPQRWFHRKWNGDSNSYDWSSPSLEGKANERELWEKTTRSNALFLSTAVQLNSAQLQPVFDWFKSKLKILNSRYLVDLDKYCDNPQNKTSFLQVLKVSDLGINNFDVKKKKFSPDALPDNMNAELKAFIIDKVKDAETIEIKTTHLNEKDEPIDFELEDESDGTQKIFNMTPTWLDALKNGSVFVVDELSASLHPQLTVFLVKLFNDEKLNSKGAQLIFTSHETAILDQSLLRRDQIWLVRKNSDSETQLNQLIEFKVIKGRDNIEGNYLLGQYGALPFIAGVQSLYDSLNQDLDTLKD